MNDFQMFGRSYGEIGKGNTDLVLNTKGEIKVRVGKQFFNLFKDGKIGGSSDSYFIKQTDDISEETEDGIYIADDGSIYIINNGETYTLKGEISNDYVSFKVEQETSLDQKYQALKNIGFIYPTLEDAQEVSQGIVYIEDKKALYIADDNGSLINLLLNLPNIDSLNVKNINGLESINESISVSNRGDLIVNSLQEFSGSFSLKTEEGKSILQIDKIESSQNIEISNLLTVYQEGGEEDEDEDIPGKTFLGEEAEDRIINNYFIVEYTYNNVQYSCKFDYSEYKNNSENKARFKGQARNGTGTKTFTIEGTIDEEGYFLTEDVNIS